MKKVCCMFLSLVATLTLLFPTVSLASEKYTNGFEFSSDSLSNEILERISSGEKSFSISKEMETSDPELGNEITVKVWTTKKTTIERTATVATDTVNWALSGRYYFKSSDETVSNYGNHGSVDYTGTKLEHEQWDAYHDVTYKYSDSYKATASTSTTNVTDGKKFIGKYRLKNTKSNSYSDDAEIYIIVKKDGSWSSKGNYGAINVD